MINSFLYISGGCVKTLWIFTLTCSISFIISIIFLRIVFLKPNWHWGIKIYIWCFRGLPLLLQILIGSLLLNRYIPLGDFWWCILVLGCNSAAYLTSIFWDGFNTIPCSYLETIKILDLGERIGFKKVIMPLVLHNTINARNGEFTTLLKDTSMLSIFGVCEIIFRAKEISYQTYDFFTPLCLAGLLFLLINLFREKYTDLLLRGIYKCLLFLF